MRDAIFLFVTSKLVDQKNKQQIIISVYYQISSLLVLKLLWRCPNASWLRVIVQMCPLLFGPKCMRTHTMSHQNVFRDRTVPALDENCTPAVLRQY